MKQKRKIIMRVRNGDKDREDFFEKVKTIKNLAKKGNLIAKAVFLKPGEFIQIGDGRIYPE